MGRLRTLAVPEPNIFQMGLQGTWVLRVNRCNHKHGFQDSSALPICSNTFPYFAVPVEGLPTGLLSQPQKAIPEIWLQDISVCLEYSSAWSCEGAAN